jgi:hypothetical protein
MGMDFQRITPGVLLLNVGSLKRAARTTSRILSFEDLLPLKDELVPDLAETAVAERKNGSRRFISGCLQARGVTVSK